MHLNKHIMKTPIMHYRWLWFWLTLALLITMIIQHYRRIISMFTVHYRCLLEVKCYWFWILSENQLCDKHKFTILKHFVQMNTTFVFF